MGELVWDRDMMGWTMKNMVGWTTKSTRRDNEEYGGMEVERYEKENTWMQRMNERTMNGYTYLCSTALSINI